ncbi:Kinesin-like protein [Forsythia ovata]|uniref:Kinesin-like protein n=1 Tax=Forsythia ovata TaxID=205694 RepID=A0ABD1T2X7_9LAMI
MASQKVLTTDCVKFLYGMRQLEERQQGEGGTIRWSCVFNTYYGTMIAHGQTDIGKTFTIGRVSDEDIPTYGIVVYSMEDTLENVSRLSFLQLSKVIKINNYLVIPQFWNALANFTRLTGLVV